MDTQEIKIPLERIAVLIGKGGEQKKKIEEKLKIRINVHSEDGDVEISGEDSVAVFEAMNVVKAIARGFNPDIAELLFDESYMFDLINVNDFANGSKKTMMRLKGRVIGQEGKARKMVEQMTSTNISVYGKTIGVIGKVEDVPMARQAVEMILEGAPHGNVYRWLEDKKREEMRRKFEDEKSY
ncbi:RNA-processing protein [Candidatus Woesearchaeota archaeon]|nr:RNA-processing protein [Candidatus Woesearchaeota archaeon]